MRFSRLGLVVLCVVGTACKPKAVTYYDDVRPIVDRACVYCHSNTGVSFSMEEPESAYAFRAAMTNAVSARRMPPWTAESGHQKYVDDISLDQSELDIFERWREGDYPKGDAKHYVPSARIEAGFKPDLTLKVDGTEGFLPSQTQRDDYHCFVTKWPLDREAYVTGFGMIPGNARIAHHAIIYAVPRRLTETYQGFADAEAGGGYRCLGGTLPDRLARGPEREAFELGNPGRIAEVNRDQLWLAHWAPGMSGYAFPEKTGIRIEPHALLVVQMHYFNGFAPNESDSGSTLVFQTADSVLKPSFNWPMSRMEWLQARDNGSLVVPANSTLSVSDEVSLAGFDKLFAALLGADSSRYDGLEIHSANVHMHLIGASGEVLLKQGESTETLLNIPRFEFGWQRDFFLAQPKRINSAELGTASIRYRCTFANPGDAPVYGGFGSEEEMCYNFSYLSLVPAAPIEKAP